VQQVTLKDILTMAKAAQGQIDRIFLHWSAGHYHQFSGGYHVNIDNDGTLYASTDDLAEVKSHTWHQNTGAIGVTMAACAFATPKDLGDPARVAQYGVEYLNKHEIPYEPPTTEQIEAMAQVVAMICYGLQLPVDIIHVRTHAEQANIDDYGPNNTWERWDLWVLPGMEDGAGGDVIRGKAIYYLEQWGNDGTLTD
jgi:hypothetical protein